jgi:hypothetical protein
VKVKQVTGSCFILYNLPDEEWKVQVVIKDETIWATQKAMAQLFGVGVPAISKHLTHILVPGGQVSGIICIINMHLSHIFDKGELGSFDNRKLTTPLQSHCCFYMYKTAYS